MKAVKTTLSKLKPGGHFKFHGLIRSKLHTFIGKDNECFFYRREGRGIDIYTKIDKEVFTDTDQLINP